MGLTASTRSSEIATGTGSRGRHAGPRDLVAAIALGRGGSVGSRRAREYPTERLGWRNRSLKAPVKRVMVVMLVCWFSWVFLYWQQQGCTQHPRDPSPFLTLC
eukprot:8877997-Pyramimonas_sp.AAC.2